MSNVNRTTLQTVGVMLSLMAIGMMLAYFISVHIVPYLFFIGVAGSLGLMVADQMGRIYNPWKQTLSNVAMLLFAPMIPMSVGGLCVALYMGTATTLMVICGVLGLAATIGVVVLARLLADAFP